jgi:endonuclease/exonuclease/phosphatase family metal-dependent hydrolase
VIGKKQNRKKHFTIYYSCDDKQHTFGTGFIVSKPIRSRVIDFKPVDKRMCVLRTRGKFKNYSFICAHAPTEEKNEREKDQFYERLERTYEQCPHMIQKILLGDVNAKVGKEIRTGTAVSACGLHNESNENGTRLINYAIYQRMVIGGTLSPHRNIHKGTWNGPDNRTVNQVGHILIDQRHFSNLLDVRSYRGANADSDHYLLTVKLRCRIVQRNNKRYRNPPKNNRDKLGVKEIKHEYVNKLVQRV